MGCSFAAEQADPMESGPASPWLLQDRLDELDGSHFSAIASAQAGLGNDTAISAGAALVPLRCLIK